MKKILLPFLFSSLSIVAALAMVTTPAQAACRDSYGGQICEGGITVDKQVWNDDEDQYQDNIDEDNFTYDPDREVKFQITVKNSGDVKFDKVLIRDFLPSYLNWSSGGNYLSGDRKVEFQVDNLEPGKSQTVTLVTKTATSGNLARGLTCSPANKVEALGYKGNDVIANDTDEAQFCVNNGTGGGDQVTEEKKTVLGATTYPSTGPEVNSLLLLEILGLVGLGGAYIYAAKSLRK